MRKTLFLLLFAALTAGAETINDVIIEPRPGVAPLRDGTYFEFRFTVLNPTTDPRKVKISVVGRVYTADMVPGSTRTVVVAPRESMVVSIPQYVLVDYTPREALVDVDGEQGKISLSGYASSSSYRSGRDILVGRTVPPPIVTALIPADQEHSVEIRAAISPNSWSSNWLHYSAFSGMILTTADWRELPRPVQGALLRWVAGGGSLTFVGGADGLPPLRPASLANVVAGHHGFGTVTLIPPSVPPVEVIAAIHGTWRVIDLDTRYMWWGQNLPDNMPVKLLDDKALPVKSIFSLLVVFAVVGGPLNLWVLAKKQRRLWIFWTLPVLGLLTAVVVIGAVIGNEGWVRIHKSLTLTLLDERIGEASTLGWTGMYATLPPDGEVRFESATEVRPMFAAPDANTDWTEGQRFMGGWIGSRVSSGFAIRKIEPRRERLPLRREGGHLVAVNGLGGDLKELWVADGGALYKATNVAAGQEVVLTRTHRALNPNANDPAMLFTAPGVWATYYNRIAANPADVIRPGMYVAVMKRSPFVEPALSNPTTYSSAGVVIGLMKGIDHAS